MVLNVTDALSAYKNSTGLMDAGSGASSTATGGNGEFGSVLKNFLGEAVGSLHEGEKAASLAASGKADLASVVTAMDNAEIVLTEITTIRDKVISAYQSITSSAI